MTAAGGVIRKNPKGLEAVVAKEITINKKGLNHKMYKGKKRIFDAFCWHFDDTETLPSNTEVLASNEKSIVQSLDFNINDSNIWDVQYHPEFNPEWIGGLMNQREELLLKENIFSEKKYFDEECDFFSNYKKPQDNKKKEKYKDLINIDAHTLELFNWIKQIKN